MIDVTQFTSLTAAKEAAVSVYRHDNPEPVAPKSEADTQRPALVSTKNGGRLWLEVIHGYNGAQIKLCNTGFIAAMEISPDELTALESEIRRALYDFEQVDTLYQNQEAFKTQQRKWQEGLWDVERAAERAWHKAHPDAEGEDEEDEDF